jgi:hypothetical protein
MASSNDMALVLSRICASFTDDEKNVPILKDVSFSG